MVAEQWLPADGHVAYAEATKTTEKNSEREFIDKAVDAPVMSQRQEPVGQKELLVEKRSLLSIADENAGRSFITSVEPKGKIEAYEQQAADAREYAVKVCDGILMLMDENLNSTASTGESTVIYYKMKGETTADLNALEKEELDRKTGHRGFMKGQKTVEVPQVQYSDRIVDMPVVVQRRVPTIQAAQKTEEVPRAQLLDRVVDVSVLMQRQVPQEQIQECIVEKIDVTVPRVLEETIEVGKLKSQLSGEKVLSWQTRSWLRNWMVVAPVRRQSRNSDEG